MLKNQAINTRFLKQFKKAHEIADETIDIFHEIGDLHKLREMLDIKSILLINSQDFNQAEPFLEESIKKSCILNDQYIGDTLDRQRYFESIIISVRHKMT
jgi:hypothetical protein